MKSIIVFYSMSGNVRMVAERIADGTRADLLEIVPQKAFPDKGLRKFLWGGKSAVMCEKPPLVPYRFDADDYDMVILASPIWASNITPPMRTFVSDNLDALRAKRLCMVFCFSGGGDAKALAKTKALLGVEDFDLSMCLVDPKDKPTEENDARIEDFCRRLAEM